MSRSIGPTNQWSEPHAVKTGGAASRFYPILEGGVWGWTRRAADADGFVVLEDGVLGVQEFDGYDEGPGRRAFGLEGSTGPMFATGAA